MLDQNQISAMMAQQQQQQQMLAMGSPSAVMGASHYPPQYNFGADTGLVQNRLTGGGGLYGGLAAGANAIAGGLNTAFSAASLASILGIGGSTVGGFAGSMLGLNPLSLGILAAAAPMGFAGGGMMHGNRMNAAVGGVLSQAGFANPIAPNGFGFGFGDQTRMAQQIIGMGAANPFVSAQDQSQLLSKFQQMGLDKGLTSMDKMMDKFKEFSKATEDVAVSLGKTVGEVTGIVQQLKGQGFYSASEVTGMTNRIAAGANYGLGFNQQMQMAAGMASTARGMGMTGQSGALVGTNLSQSLGAAFSIDNLDSNLAMDLTGTTNTADASVALGQRFGTSIMAQFNRGGKLSDLMSGLVKVGPNGNLVLDDKAIAAASSGALSINDIKNRGQNVLSNANLKGKFANNQSQLASDLLSTNKGATAAFGLLKNIAGEEAASNGMDQEDVFVNLARTWGISSEREARLLYDFIEDLEETSSKRLMDDANYVAAQKRRAYLTRERSFAAVKQKVKHEMSMFTSNPALASKFAAASNNFSAGLNALERDFLGIDLPSSAIYTQSNVDDVLGRMVTGELDTRSMGITAGPLQNDLFGNASMDHRTRMAAAAQGLRVNEFGELVRGGVDLTGKGTLDADTLQNFYDHTTDEYRNATFLSNRTATTLGTLGGFATGRVATGLLGGGIGRLAMNSRAARRAGANLFYSKQIVGGLGKLGGVKGHLLAAGIQAGGAYLGMQLGGSGTDEEQLYQSLMEEAKSKGATSEAEAHAMIAQTEDGAAALRNYMQKYGSGESFNLTSMAKANYLAATQEEVGYGRMAMQFIGGYAGYSAGTAVGSLAGPVGTVAGAVVGGFAGERLGAGIYDYFFGNNVLKEQQKAGHGAKVLALFKSESELKDLDKMYKDELRNNGNSPGKARAALAKRLSEKYGQNITGTDVETALYELDNATGQTLDERIQNGDYSKGLNAAKLARGYVDAEIAASHMSEVGANLTGETDATLSAIREAALVGDSGTMMSQMRKFAAGAQDGSVTYTGDSEFAQALMGSKDIFGRLKDLEGKDVSALDKVFGSKGAGARLRKMAGVTSSGALTETELREIANVQASLDAYSTQTAKSKQGLASSGIEGESDTQRLATATKNLVESTKDLASYVDKIGANVYDKEPVGTD